MRCLKELERQESAVATSQEGSIDNTPYSKSDDDSTKTIQSNVDEFVTCIQK